MPDPRPFSTLRRGTYDEPPANSEPSTPGSRRFRLQRALQSTSDLAHEAARMSDVDPRVQARASLGRRRRRSPSTHADERGGRAGTSTAEEDRIWRSKRRRLDPDAASMSRPGIRYGWFGQVEAGRLRLELISCDGGEHVDSRHPQTYLGAKNVLRHDKSVYCSELPSSCIILKHLDDTPFSLEKLHIVGPEHGFTAPVREGLVYVALTLNDLRKYIDPPRHARRSGLHTPPYRSRRTDGPGPRGLPPEQLTLTDALRDPEVHAAFEHPGRTEEARVRAEDGDEYRRRYLYPNSSDPQCDVPSSAGSPVSEVPYGDSAPVTLMSDEEPGPEDNTSQEVLDFRLQRLRLMRRRFEMENLDRDERWAGLSGLRLAAASSRAEDSEYNLERIDALMARSRVYDSPHPEPAESPAARDWGGDPPPPGRAPSAAEGINDANVTCARFQIKQGKHKVAIKFDPGVSGRFIMLKLWAPRQSNVDVQSVIAKGFGGGRFFPAMQFR